MKKTIKRRRKMDSKEDAIYKALKNPKQMTSIIDGNGTKIWLDPFGFISALNKYIKRHKKHLSVENAEKMITCYEMPAIQRCLEGVLMMNRNSSFDENDLHKYIARRFEDITVEMLSKDYQTEKASKFKEEYDHFKGSTM
jgi:hypothetical protein